MEDPQCKAELDLQKKQKNQEKKQKLQVHVYDGKGSAWLHGLSLVCDKMITARVGYLFQGGNWLLTDDRQKAHNV